MKNKKFKPLIFVGILAVVCAVVGYTVAYYYSNIVVPNQFQSMTYNVQITEEDFNNTFGTKKVFFKNEEETNTPVVLRFNFNESWGNGVNNLINGTNVVTKTWTDAFTNDFALGDDGWYYYKKVLNPQESVQVLESISRNDTLINSSPNRSEYVNSNYHLDINFEAIQATPEAVSEIWNKSITITGTSVTWPTPGL